jgi:hypothetical protein
VGSPRAPAVAGFQPPVSRSGSRLTLPTLALRAFVAAPRTPPSLLLGLPGLAQHRSTYAINIHQCLAFVKHYFGALDGEAKQRRIRFDGQRGQC